MIDLDAYLHRIGHDGPRRPTLDVLSSVCARHPAHIPYENIAPLLGTPPSLEPAAVARKLVASRRGGYCFEQNLLLQLALEALGFEVQALAARVVWMRPADAPPRPRTHMLLKVQVHEGEAPGTYIADAGFGGNLMDAPVALVVDAPQRLRHATLRTTRDGDDHVAETLLPTGWAPMYRYTLAPQSAADYEPLNWYTATHPGSIFRHNLLLERLTPEQRLGLFNDRLVLRRPGLPPAVRRVQTLQQFADTLQADFGLQLAPDECAALWERVPKGLDQFVTPAA